jgi:hypothetical protein
MVFHGNNVPLYRQACLGKYNYKLKAYTTILKTKYQMKQIIIQVQFTDMMTFYSNMDVEADKLKD